VEDALDVPFEFEEVVLSELYLPLLQVNRLLDYCLQVLNYFLVTLYVKSLIDLTRLENHLEVGLG